MNRHFIGSIGILCVMAAGPSHAQTAMESNERFVCTSGTSQRLVSIFIRPVGAKTGAAACRVDYTKDGKTQTVWESKSDRAFCTAKAIGLVTKLGQGNYSCKPEAAVKPEEPESAE